MIETGRGMASLEERAVGEPKSFGLVDILALVLILAVAGGTRAWYVYTCAGNGEAAPVFEVQGGPPAGDFPADTRLRDQAHPSEVDNLVHNLTEHQWFGSLAPFADAEERTAHVAPGYPWLFAMIGKLDVPTEQFVRWGQCILGVLTVMCFFSFAWQAFASRLVPYVTGLLCAVHPFWILNTPELNDGVLSAFLLGAALMLGTKAGRSGGAFSSLLFGLSLAGLAMVRAELLPFTLVAIVWFLGRCRAVRLGWLCALLGLLGYANGLAPWAVRNFQHFQEVIPIANSAFLHLWMGNNPQATGGYLDEKTLRASVSSERLEELLKEDNQARRYNGLAQDVLDEVQRHPAEAVSRRLDAGLTFVLGENWFKGHTLASVNPSATLPESAEWLPEMVRIALPTALLGMLILGFLGWRWSFAWRRQSRLAALALLWIPLPYVLSHAGPLSGPRLPLDGVLLCFAAFALVSCGTRISKGPEREDKKKKKIGGA